jgi:hypothetical protein
MPIKNNYVEASELTRRKRLTTIAKATTAAEARKFRALTVFDSYDPSFVLTKKYSAEVCNDSCKTGEKQHNITNTLSLSYKNVNRVGSTLQPY